MELKTSGPAPVGKDLYIVKTGEWRFQRPVVTIEKCTRCGICFIFCPVNAITEKDNCYEANLEVCKGCGICANECHAGAVAMVMERRE